MNCQFTKLDDSMLDDSVFDEVFDEVFAIMDQSFPNAEMREYAGQKELLKHKDYCLYATKNEQGHCIAFIAAWEPGDFLYLEHFAVEQNYRSNGMGGVILSDFLKQKKLPVVLEVELPNTEITKRRIGFYERVGFALNLYEYLQPPYRKGQNPFPLYFMTYPSAIDEKQFVEYKKYLYNVVYRIGVGVIE